MDRLDTSEMGYWRSIATRLALIVITVTLIVWFLPREEGQQFRYDVSKPWTYGSVIAKFDFPVYKTDEVIKHEQDSLLKLYQPYYNYNTDVEKQMVEKFLKDFQNGMPGLPSSFKNLVYQQLHHLYQSGIMSTPEFNKFAQDTLSQVRIVTGKSAQSIAVKNVYSTLSAYEQIFQDERLAAQRQQLQKCNLNEYISPNLIYDKERSETERVELLSSLPIASNMVLAGQKIIDRGDIVDDYTYRVLTSFEREMKRRQATQSEITTTVIGQIIFVTIMMMLFTLYLSLFRRDYFQKPRSILMLYTLITIFPILVSLMVSHNFLSIYILPFAMTPMFIRVFMDSRTAFIAHVIMVLLCAIAVKYQYDFILIQLVAGLVAIYSLRDLSRRAQIFKTAILVTIASCITYFALQLMQDNVVLSIDRDMYVYFIINGVILLLAYPLMYLIERTFGFTSDVTLFELSNTNKGLLRDLSEIAPGTFQHSITVGNLAAEIANRIEANSLLVRTGALYHDIGKMANPVFFTENQVGVNPHDNMPYTESARIVISHITEGMKMAEKAGLPAIIKNFILTHHGRGLTKYFYIKQQNEHPDEEIDKEPFTYPGPNPFTREQAILMMADAVEAASRSLTEYTEENISQLVNRIIDSQVSEGYFRECPINFRDIADAKRVLIDRLKSIYHTRISYPKLKKEVEPQSESQQEEKKDAEKEKQENK
ncbi:MAG: HDIG domain-containing protein [Prevotella sp.]|nr:HDIG domain-containing protein [Prevotella sp.]